MHVTGPYMTLKQAAQYLGYHPDTLRRKLHEYDIPRYGPEQNRFAKSVLDNFMQSPETFRRAKEQKRKRSPQMVTV